MTVRTVTREVIDGAHRIESVRRLGCSTVTCVLVDIDDDAVFGAHMRANAHHGLPLTLAEKRAAALTLLRADPTRADHESARI